MVQETAAQFQRAGYRIELHVVAVPMEVSRLGTISRYINQVQQDGAGRWTPAAAHDIAAAAVPHTAAELVRAGFIEHMSIENRQGTPYFQSTPHVHDRDSTATAVIAVIDKARNPKSTGMTEAQQWLDTAIADVQTCVRTQQTDPDLLATIDTVVHTDAPKIAAIAFPRDVQAQHEVLNRLRRTQRPEIGAASTAARIAGVGTSRSAPELSRDTPSSGATRPMSGYPLRQVKNRATDHDR